MRKSNSRTRGLVAVGLVVLGGALCLWFGGMLLDAGVRLDEGTAAPRLDALFLGVGSGLVCATAGAVIGFREIGIALDRRRRR